MIDISISPAAAEHLREELEGKLLRISFATGCGGSGYRLASADEPFDGDEVVTVDGIRVALDEMARSNLQGARIEADEEEGLTLDHPAAAVAIWCG